MHPERWPSPIVSGFLATLLDSARRVMVRDVFRLSPGCRKKSDGRSLSFERLEERLAMTWIGAPPVNIVPPADAVSATLNSKNDDKGGDRDDD